MRLSISDAASWARRFLIAEWRLLAPVALAFLVLPAVATQLLVPGLPAMSADPARVGPALGWLVPMVVLGLVGGMTVTALALVPGIAVGEAMGRAARRLWVVLAAWAIVAAGMLVLLTVVTFAALLLGASPGMLQAAGVWATMLGFLAVFARLLLLVPVVIEGGQGPVASLRRAWALMRGHFWHVLGGCIVLFFTVMVVLAAARTAIAAVALILARLTGAEGVLTALAVLILACLAATISTSAYVLVAAIYRQVGR